MYPVVSARRVALLSALCVLGWPRAALTQAEEALVPPELLEDVAGQLPEWLVAAAPLTAELRVQISADGAVEAAQVHALIPAPAPEHQALLEALAVEQALQLRFAPARRGVAPIAVTIRVALQLTPPREIAAHSAAQAEQVRAVAESIAAAQPPAPPVGVVRTRGQREREAAASDLRIELGGLREAPRSSAEQLLTLAPGVSLSNHGGEGHPSAVFMRGFNAGEGQDIAFSAMGVPLNDPSNPHGHGFADTHFLLPELVRAVRVTQGPFDPRQGDFAVAGSVDFELGARQPGVEAFGGWGQFATRRAGLIWAGEADDQGHPASFVGLDVRQSDGFGVNRASSSSRLLAGHEAQLTEQTRLVGWFGSYTGRFDTAGVLRLDDLVSGDVACARAGEQIEPRLCTYDPNQGGQMGRHGGGVRFEGQDGATRWSQALHGAVRRMALRENYTGYTTDINAEGTQRGDGLESVYASWMLGASGAYGFAMQAWGQRHEVELGYAARVDSAQILQRRLRAVGGQPYRATLDQEAFVSHLGAYLATKLALTSTLGLDVGGRVDTFGFSVRDMNRPTRDRQGERLGEELTTARGAAWSPRATLRWRLGGGVDWITAWGRGVRSSEAAALSQGEFAPFARTHALETGFLGAHHAWGWGLEWRAAAFETYVDRDLVFDEQAGRNLFAGASNRFGAQGLVRARRGERVDVMGSLSWTEAHQPGAADAWWAIWAGPRLPYIPRWVARVDGSWREHVGEVELVGALGWTWMAGRPLPFEQRGQSQNRLDVAGSAAWGAVSLGVQVTNLLDQPYREAEFYYASNFAGPERAVSELPTLHVIAGAPRTWLLTASVALDPLLDGVDGADQL